MSVWFDHKSLLEFFGILATLLGCTRLLGPEAWRQLTETIEAVYAFKLRLRELRSGSRRVPDPVPKP